MVESGEFYYKEMFIGEYKHTIDDKGRLSVPSKFRALLQKGAIVTRGIDSCLFLYPKAEWELLAEKLAKLPLSQEKNRAFARLMLAGAMDVSLDGQGRINIPEYLIVFAGLKKNVAIAGLYNRLEIWDEAIWNKYKRGAEKNSAEIAETLGGVGV